MSAHEPWPGRRRRVRPVYTPSAALRGWLVTASVAAVALVSAALLWTLPAGSAALRHGRCASVAECRRAIDWWRGEARRVARARFLVAYPRLLEAAFLVARAFPGVDPWAMVRVARCESAEVYSSRARWISDRNGATATGAWQWLDSTWAASPFARFDRRNVYVEALATAQLVSRDGWRQWVCKP